MFHAFDNLEPNRPLPRPAWMALLSRAPLALLESAVSAQASAGVRWLRRPETGLMMVQGRVGGTGERFNLGEVTVTRCALRLAGPGGEAPVGVSYVLGRHQRQCELAAVADVLLQDPAQHEALEASLLAPVRRHLADEAARRQAGVLSTQVEFFTLARESGGNDDDEEGGA